MTVNNPQEQFKVVARPDEAARGRGRARQPVTDALIETATRAGTAVEITVTAALKKWVGAKRMTLRAHGYRLHYRVTSAPGLLPLHVSAWATRLPASRPEP
jgi:hypothetical protein